jgi:hypothetical protein
MLIKLLLITTSELLEIASEVDKLFGLQSLSPKLVRKYAAALCFIVAILLMAYDYSDNTKTNNDKKEIENVIIIQEDENNDIIQSSVVEEINSPISVASSTGTSNFSPYSNINLSPTDNNDNFEVNSKILMDSDKFIDILVKGISVFKVKASQSKDDKDIKIYKLTGKGYLKSDKTSFFNQFQQYYKLSRLNKVSLENENNNNDNDNNLSLLLKFVGKSNSQSLEIKGKNNEITKEHYNGFLSILKRSKLENNRKWFKANIVNVLPGSTPSSQSSSMSSTPFTLSRSNSVDSLTRINSNSKLGTLVEGDNEELTPNASPDRKKN